MDRKRQLSAWPKITFPPSIGDKELNAAYQKGMLKKEQLEDKQYYLGYCRNAYVAQWVKEENAFYYMRNKFADFFPEKIFHPADDNDRDLFIPFKKVEPSYSETIQKEKIESFVLHRRQG